MQCIRYGIRVGQPRLNHRGAAVGTAVGRAGENPALEPPFQTNCAGAQVLSLSTGVAPTFRVCLSLDVDRLVLTVPKHTALRCALSAGVRSLRSLGQTQKGQALHCCFTAKSQNLQRALLDNIVQQVIMKPKRW